MLQLENETPFAAGLFVFPDAQAIDTLYVAVKATFAVEGTTLRIADPQLPVIPADECWGEEGTSSLRYAGEAHLAKPCTDVALVGEAHAPGGKPSALFGASLAVGRLRKVVHVHGDRVWRAGVASASPSPAVPVTTVPLRWEQAYGGSQLLPDGRLLSERRNPVGRGFRGKRSLSELNGQPLPNLEDPRQPIRGPGDAPPPACFGFIAPSWEPRASLAGTYDEAWRRRRAPYLPADFDPRFLQAAAPDLVYPGRLTGGEPVELLNVSPRGTERFALPACELEVRAAVDGEELEPPMAVETLLLEPGRGRLSLLFRGAVPCDKKVLRVEGAAIRIRSLKGVAA